MASIRLKLFEADPFCFWCGKKVAIEGPTDGPDFATVDHLYSKLHPDRKNGRSRDAETKRVLACRSCNHERSVAEQLKRTFVPQLSWRRKTAARYCATLAREREKYQPEVEMPTHIDTIEKAIRWARGLPVAHEDDKRWKVRRLIKKD